MGSDRSRENVYGTCPSRDLWLNLQLCVFRWCRSTALLNSSVKE
jgi:hypothetical protein